VAQRRERRLEIGAGNDHGWIVTSLP
jgi:hypothetical protein